MIELTEAGRKYRNEYMKEYRRKNKERIRENEIRCFNRKGEKLKNENKE